MSEAQSISQSHAELERAIDEVLKGSGIDPDRRADGAATGPAPARPVEPVAGGRGALWGPSSTRVTSPSTIRSPMELLAEVVAHAGQLQKQMSELVTAITGEVPATRQRQPVPSTPGLLPTIALLAHEIELANLQTARLIAHVRERVG